MSSFSAESLNGRYINIPKLAINDEVINDLPKLAINDKLINNEKEIPKSAKFDPENMIVSPNDALPLDQIVKTNHEQISKLNELRLQPTNSRGQTPSTEQNTSKDLKTPREPNTLKHPYTPKSTPRKDFCPKSIMKKRQTIGNENDLKIYCDSLSRASSRKKDLSHKSRTTNELRVHLLEAEAPEEIKIFFEKKSESLESVTQQEGTIEHLSVLSTARNSINGERPNEFNL